MSKISAYSDGGAIQSTDKFVIARGGANYHILGSQIGSGLTISSASVTTGNVTGVEGTLHNLDVSGMTANRDFNLPTPSAAGKRVGVRLSVGDATYALLLKINAVEWSRIFITGEIVIFVSTGTGAADWVIEQDGRIPCVAKIKNTAGGQTINNTTATVVTLDETDYDNASLANTGNNRIDLRRTNKYLIFGYARYNGISAAIPRCNSYIREVTSTNVLVLSEFYAASGSYPALPMSSPVSLSSGNQVRLEVYQDSGASQAILTSATDYPYIAVQEVLT